MKLKRFFACLLAGMSILSAFAFTSCKDERTSSSKADPSYSSEEEIEDDGIDVEVNEDSILKGNTYLFLGSSVTYGPLATGISMVDILAKQESVTCYKYAVPGTTLVDVEGSDQTYIKRMETIDKTLELDHFICQLSTNDATQKKPLGMVAADLKDPYFFDRTTIIGAMEYIIWYAQTTWNCPVSFYTGTPFYAPLYIDMIDALYELQEKWGIGIIDLYNNEELNSISDELYAQYMTDKIHPTFLGYRDWWLPEFVKHLECYEKE